MQTIAMPERALGMAWLEHFPEDGGAAQRIALDRFPFVIGRSESADLQVNSARVSREHAVLVEDCGEYYLRDLGSTNGTYVNGKRIEEAVLHHGDMLLVANREFTFGCGRPEACLKTLAQCLGGESLDIPGRRAADVRLEVRRLNEILMRGCMQTVLDPIIHMGENRVYGYESRGETADPTGIEAGRLLHSSAWPVAARIRHVLRMRAVEETLAFPGNPAVFLPLEAGDLDQSRLAESLGSLRHLLPDNQRLVVVLPCAARNRNEEEQLVRRLREAGIGVAWDGFSGQSFDLFGQTSAPCDFLKLCSSLVRGVQNSPEHQRIIQTAVRAGHQGGWDVIAAGIRSKEERNVCEGLGCLLGQGPLFADPKPGSRRPRAPLAV